MVRCQGRDATRACGGGSAAADQCPLRARIPSPTAETPEGPLPTRRGLIGPSDGGRRIRG
ncbi:hypothetical protein LX36DRAFT_664150 [Colletotrichum falcatum]|nr:hypothetical protein LX36DRAFT_664150 [Colletotrichum falcatum]